ncbi:hypothetical protein D3C79_654570 [compost metagenome]
MQVLRQRPGGLGQAHRIHAQRDKRSNLWRGVQATYAGQWHQHGVVEIDRQHRVVPSRRKHTNHIEPIGAQLQAIAAAHTQLARQRSPQQNMRGQVIVMGQQSALAGLKLQHLDQARSAADDHGFHAHPVESHGVHAGRQRRCGTYALRQIDKLQPHQPAAFDRRFKVGNQQFATQALKQLPGMLRRTVADVHQGHQCGTTDSDAKQRQHGPSA